MATFYYVLNPVPRKDGEHGISLRITQNRKPLRLDTGKTTPEALFEQDASAAKLRWISKKHPQSGSLNEFLKARWLIANAIGDANPFATAEELRNHIKKAWGGIVASPTSEPEPEPSTPQNDFIAYFRQHIRIVSATYSQRRTNRFKTALNHFLNHLDGREVLPFAELTPKLLQDFYVKLFTKGHAHNNVATIFRDIKAVINAAIDDDDIPLYKSPARRISIGFMPGELEFLNLEEVIRIEALNFPKDSMIFHARNAFLFQIWLGGTRISDIITLKWKRFRRTNGAHFHQMKSKAPVTFDLPDRLLPILNHYKKGKSEEYVFPFLPTHKDLSNKDVLDRAVESATFQINRFLSGDDDEVRRVSGENTIIRLAGIDRHITTHCARHTFSNLAIQMEGMTPRELQGILGHATLEQTETYLKKISNEQVREGLNKFHRILATQKKKEGG